MADTAHVLRSTYFSNGTGQWGITVEVMLGELGQRFEAVAESPVQNPDGGWKPIIRAAIIARAAAEFGPGPEGVVDIVIFPDYSVLSSTS